MPSFGLIFSHNVGMVYGVLPYLYPVIPPHRLAVHRLAVHRLAVHRQPVHQLLGHLITFYCGRGKKTSPAQGNLVTLRGDIRTRKAACSVERDEAFFQSEDYRESAVRLP